MRLRVAVAVACLSIVGMSAADDVNAAIRRSTEIPAQGLGPALQLLAKEHGFQIVYVSEEVNSLRTQGASGELTSEEALTQLLVGTGLTFRSFGDNAVSIVPVGSRALRSTSVEAVDRAGADAGWFGRLRLAQSKEIVATDTAPAAGGADSVPSPRAATVEEVIVTANRRQQRAQDVASGIQVFQGADLDRRGASGFQDYLLQVPEVSLRDQGNGATRIALRGVSNLIGSDYGTTTTVSTVGLYLNDVPIQGTSVLPDLSLYDLARVEVLKGPQGTLYGEGAMGGAVRMILQAPNFERAEGKSDVMLSNTHSGGMNYRVRSMVNAPLGSSTAVRLVGTYQENSGYVDNLNPAVAEKDYNDSTSYSARGTFLAQFTDRFSAELLGLFNSQDLDAPGHVMKGLGDLVINQPDQLQQQSSSTEATILGLTLKYELPFAELTSVTSRYSNDRQLVTDFPISSGVVPVIRDNSTHADIALDSRSQEIRLVSQGDHRFDWILGAFYRDKETHQLFTQTLIPSDFVAANTFLAAAGRPIYAHPRAYHETGIETYEQYAAYAEGNLALTDSLELTVGLRWYDEERTYDPSFLFEGPLAPNTSNPDVRGVSDDGVVPKIGLAYRVSPDHLVYALASKGFRTSVINLNYRPDGLGLGGPSADSDSLWNYEIGAKTLWRDGRVMINGTAYYIDWSEIQLPLVGISPFLGVPTGYISNGGEAEVYGGSIESVFVLTDTFSLGANVGYAHSEMISGAELGVTVGAELPNTPQWTASAQAEYRRPFSGRGEFFARLTGTFVDEQTTRVLTVRETNARPLASYTMADLRLGTELNNGWGFSLFVDNLTDERAELGRGIVGSILRHPELVSVARPRTIGLMISGSF